MTEAFEEFRRTRDAEVIDVATVTPAIKHSAVRNQNVCSGYVAC